MIKWRTPFGKWASYAIYGTYAFIGWNALPVAVYYIRKNQYEVRYEKTKDESIDLNFFIQFV